MTNKPFSYHSDDYDRQSQRFITPLFIKDQLGNYSFSSTGTFVKYGDHFYMIFAAHALKENNIDNICFFNTDGAFDSILKHAIGYRIFDNEDIVLVDYFNNCFDGKNYFNLNENHLLGFEENFFAWTGFPASNVKLKKAHNSKSKELLKDSFIHSDASGLYSTSAKYFTIISKIVKNNRNFISGKFEREKTILKYKGPVNIAPYPKGMSGGAMYFFEKRQRLKKNIDDSFRFAGIGIEYRKDNTILGVSKGKIIELLIQFDKENPLTIYSVENNFGDIRN